MKPAPAWCRQLHYSLHNQRCIDLVLFLNGLPLAAIELKTDTTQNIEDAVRQPICTIARQWMRPASGPSLAVVWQTGAGALCRELR